MGGGAGICLWYAWCWGGRLGGCPWDHGSVLHHPVDGGRRHPHHSAAGEAPHHAGWVHQRRRIPVCVGWAAGPGASATQHHLQGYRLPELIAGVVIFRAVPKVAQLVHGILRSCQPAHRERPVRAPACISGAPHWVPSSPGLGGAQAPGTQQPVHEREHQFGHRPGDCSIGYPVPSAPLGDGSSVLGWVAALCGIHQDCECGPELRLWKRQYSRRDCGTACNLHRCSVRCVWSDHLALSGGGGRQGESPGVGQLTLTHPYVHRGGRFRGWPRSPLHVRQRQGCRQGGSRKMATVHACGVRPCARVRAL